MGILTSAYQIPLDLLARFRREPRMLDLLIYGPETVSLDQPGLPAGWQAPRCSFDKSFEDMAQLLRNLGHYDAGSTLEYGGTVLHYPSPNFHCRYWRKTRLQKIQRSLKGRTAAEIIQSAEGRDDLTDWSGDPVSPEMLDYHFQSYNDLCAMIADAIQKSEAILAISS